MATSVLCCSEGTEQSEQNADEPETVVVAVIDDWVMYWKDIPLAFPDDFSSHAFGFFSQPQSLFRDHVAQDGAAEKIGGFAGCEWGSNSIFAAPPRALRGSSAGKRRVCVVTGGCVQVVDMDRVTGALESVLELSTGDEDSLVSITSAQVIGTSSLVLSGHIGGVIFPQDSEVRIVEFAADGMRVVNEFDFPRWVLQEPLIKIDDQTLLGLDAYEERGFWLRKDSNGPWRVEHLSEAEIARHYQHITYQFATPLGSQPMFSSSSRGTNLRVGGERLVGPAHPHGNVRCGWVRRDTGDVYALLESGDVMRLQTGVENRDWIKVFESPEEFRPLLEYGYMDRSTSFGATLREGEIWMARGKDRVALMRVDLDGNAAPEWEWLVNE